MIHLLSRLNGVARIEDAVDVLLVALVLFFLIEWFRRSRARAIGQRLLVIAGPLLGALFLSVRFHLPMLEALLQPLILVLLVSLALTFQSDLRRLLDRLAAYGWRGEKHPDTVEDTPDLLAEAAFHMAGTQTGALIAVHGRDPWDSFLRGGVELGGVLSKPLLYSI
ncbi:MAG: hypothetical protein LBG44_10485, partial [Gemmatimonadota bacterium]|nr:hypothetical protein [Gemmatimonadota bacterium]